MQTQPPMRSLVAAAAGLPTLIVKVVREQLDTLLLEKRKCFKNIGKGRHGYENKRACCCATNLRNKAKRLRAQCMEAITKQCSETLLWATGVGSLAVVGAASCMQHTTPTAQFL